MKKLLIVPLLVLLAGCPATTRVVNVPIPVQSHISKLPPVKLKSEELTLEDRKNYEKVAKTHEEDLQVLKRRNEIYEKIIDIHNGDN